MSLFKKLIIFSGILSLCSAQVVFAEFLTEFRIEVSSDYNAIGLWDPFTLNMQVENHSSENIILNFTTGCQMGLEVFKEDVLVFSDDMYPRNCSSSSTSISIPSDKRAVWTRTLNSEDEGYPFNETGIYKVHGYLLDNPEEGWYTQTTSYFYLTVGEDSAYIFKDIFYHWGREYIEKLYNNGIAQGYEDGGFHPDANINRAEMLKMAVTGAEINMPITFDDENFTFTDLDEWQKPFVYAAWKDGVVQGYDETTFAPAQNVTRAEALKIALLAFGYYVPDTSDEFAFDDTQRHWASSYINEAYKKLIVSGDPDGGFRPDDPLTRAEAAKIIINILES